MVTQKNRLNKTVLLSTQNTYKIYGLEMNYNSTLIKFPYLDLCVTMHCLENITQAKNLNLEISSNPIGSECWMEKLPQNINNKMFTILPLKFLHKIVNMLLSVNLNLCFGCSKEPSQRDGSFEHPQHMF